MTQPLNKLREEARREAIDDCLSAIDEAETQFECIQKINALKK